jgi:hypothetical protein
MPTTHTHEFTADLTEPSPSAGPRATAAALSAEYGLGRHTVTIVDGDEEETFEVDHKHLKDYLGVSS